MRRKRRMISIICLLLSVFLLIPTVKTDAETIKTPYTYTWDFWEWWKESPDAYSVSKVLIGDELGIGNFSAPQGLFVVDKSIFICDTGKNRIVELTYQESDGKFAFVKEFNAVNNEGKVDNLNGPKDVFVTEDREYYICDTGNQRVLHTDQNLNVIDVILKPDDETFAGDADFLPSKLVVDSAGRIYIQATNINKGFMEYDSRGFFTGYIGASEVKFNFADYVWKLLYTAEQKSRVESFVPTEYSNITLDSEGFIYATIDKFDVRRDEMKPIRKLNATGKDILIRNGIAGSVDGGRSTPSGDMYGEGGGITGYSTLVDITVMENDTYYALDRKRGRVFGYDFQGNLLYAFGGYGYREGYFRNPSALEKLGDSLLILDEELCSLTLMTLTEYGSLINKGLSEYKRGNYEESATYWQEVMKRNGNYDLAYIGIGRALLRQEEYQEAMKYFKVKMDYKNYSKAYKLYRKEWVEDNIGVIFAVIIVLIVFTFVRSTIKKIRREVREA